MGTAPRRRRPEEKTSVARLARGAARRPRARAFLDRRRDVPPKRPPKRRASPPKRPRRRRGRSVEGSGAAAAIAATGPPPSRQSPRRTLESGPARGGGANPSARRPDQVVLGPVRVPARSFYSAEVFRGDPRRRRGRDVDIPRRRATVSKPDFVRRRPRGPQTARHGPARRGDDGVGHPPRPLRERLQEPRRVERVVIDDDVPGSQARKRRRRPPAVESLERASSSTGAASSTPARGIQRLVELARRRGGEIRGRALQRAFDRGDQFRRGAVVDRRLDDSHALERH